MEKDDYKNRSNSFFNEEDEFYFMLNDGTKFKSKCHYYNGNYYTNEGLNWKCTSIKSLKNKEHEI